MRKTLYRKYEALVGRRGTWVDPRYFECKYRLILVYVQSVPQLNIAGEETSIQSGEKLEITCRCNSMVQWDYPTDVSNDINMRLEVETRMKSGRSSQKSYTSILRVSDTTYLDTGEYLCKIKSITDGPSNQTSASIYVYVKSNDTDHLLLPLKSTNIGIVAGLPFTIPCRVTDPSANVILRTRSERIRPDGESVRLDKKKGFVIKEEYKMESGFAKCVINKQEGYSDTKGVPQLSITDERTSFISGDRLQINCSSNTEVEWEYPIQHGNDIDMRLEVVTWERTNENNEKYFISALTVMNAIYLDTGLYQCRVLTTGSDRVTGQTSASVNVFVTSNGK
ncbi:vascular endothelial growth factor receptor 1-like [Ptychodera flava]|uniref:vascular endothelial growth factor receptor 1-like n=1 Tax=Ptychodera flava TaxID=63121 RepID=UPI003969EAC8